MQYKIHAETDADKLRHRITGSRAAAAATREAPGALYTEILVDGSNGTLHSRQHVDSNSWTERRGWLHVVTTDKPMSATEIRTRAAHVVANRNYYNLQAARTA